MQLSIVFGVEGYNNGEKASPKVYTRGWIRRLEINRLDFHFEFHKLKILTIRRSLATWTITKFNIFGKRFQIQYAYCKKKNFFLIQISKKSLLF